MRGRTGVVLAAVSVLLVVLGEAGHVLLDQLNAVVAHHVFHIVFPLIAFAVFAGFVAHEVREHGWPAFSWRLGAEAAPSRPPAHRSPVRGRAATR